MALAQQYHSIEKECYTEDEYFEFERTSFGRWEYVKGEIRAMSGGTADHSTAAGNIARALGNALVPKGCRVFGSDMKVHTRADVNTFPDVSVVCGPLGFYQGRKDIITNPLLIVEVLSDSPEAYDRGGKFRHYQTIPTLTDYLLVAQDEARIELYTRHDDHWDYRDISGLTSAVYLPSVETTLALSDIYALSEIPRVETRGLQQFIYRAGSHTLADITAPGCGCKRSQWPPPLGRRSQRSNRRPRSCCPTGTLRVPGTRPARRGSCRLSSA